MRAVVNDRYGSPDILAIRDMPKPDPAAGEIRVRIHATTVGRTDACALRAHPFFVRPFTGLFRPKRVVLGLDFAGVVDDVGQDVTEFEPGDRVFGLTPGGYGAHADYLCMPVTGAVARMPEGSRFEEVVVCEGAWYANTYLSEFGLRSGHEILIYGASGAIGTAAVQLARFYGAEVTAVVATRHLDLAASLGAHHVVDYTEHDFTKLDERFDFILDAVGKSTYFDCRPLLKKNGVFAATDLGRYWQNMWLSIWTSMTGSGRVLLPTPHADRQLAAFIRDRIEACDLRAVIDRKYALDDIADAYRYADTEQKTGIVVIEVVPDDVQDSDHSRTS